MSVVCSKGVKANKNKEKGINKKSPALCPRTDCVMSVLEMFVSVSRCRDFEPRAFRIKETTCN